MEYINSYHPPITIKSFTIFQRYKNPLPPPPRFYTNNSVSNLTVKAKTDSTEIPRPKKSRR